MIQLAPLPANESARRVRLQELAILDTAPEPLFDTLARMACQITGVPIALLSLIDAERQWFKALQLLVARHEGLLQEQHEEEFRCHRVRQHSHQDAASRSAMGRDDAGALVHRHGERCIHHAQRLKDALGKEFGQRVPGHHLDQAPQYVGVGA